MAVQEVSENGVLPAGVWKHPVTGEELIAVQTAKFGNPQASGYQRAGFVFHRALTAKELEEVNKVPDPTVTQPVVDSTKKTVAELEAELAEAKEREAQEKKVTDGEDEEEGKGKPLSRQNLEELKATAEKEGVEVSDDAKKADIVSAIEAKREGDK